MISQNIQDLITHLEIVSKKLVSGPLQSDVKSAIKGSGFEFHQLRDYIQGDDIRFIDWKASSRAQKMLVREYLEDRNRTVYIVVDISASTFYTTEKESNKGDRMKELAALLAFISLYKKDAVGLILFSAEIEKIIPARQSRQHVLALINTLFTYQAKKKSTQLNVPFDYLARLKGKGAIVCFISDFLGEFNANMVAVAARRHDILAFRCLDEREKHFPHVGTLIFKDAESGVQREISGSVQLTDELSIWHKRQKDFLISAKIDSLDIEVGKPYTGLLARFLRQRIYG